MTLSLTLVVPCYREAARLEPDRFIGFVEGSPGTRLIFVDDGSPDETPRVLKALATRLPDRIAVLTLPKNLGKGEAVRQGLVAALEEGADLVGFWDADLATPLELVEGFRRVFAEQPAVHWVLGSRWRGLGRHIVRNTTRHYISRIFATVVSVMLGLPVYDSQCGAKVFRTEDVLRRVLATPFLSRWVFDVEMLARYVRAYRDGLADDPITALCEYPLATWIHDGRSHVRMADFVLAAKDLWRIRKAYLSAQG